MDLESIKKRIRLSDVIGRDVRLKQRGGHHIGCCPFHREKTPSFFVYNDKGRYHCFGCGVHGDVIEYLEQKHGHTFMEALQQVADMAGVELPNRNKSVSFIDKMAVDLLDMATTFFETHLETPYLEQRGILPKTCRTFRLGFCPPGNGLYQHLSKHFDAQALEASGLFLTPNKPRFADRIMFPIRNLQGQIVGFGGRSLRPDHQPKYLNSKESELFLKKELLYGLYENQRASAIFMVEGYLDVIQLYQHDYAAVAPMGTAASEAQLQLLWKQTAKPILCFDGDAAGKRAEKRLIQIALPHITPEKTLFSLHLPEGEDPDSLLRGTPHTFKELQKNPIPLIDALWEHEKPSLPASPEAMAAADQHLQGLAKQIQHPVLSKWFRSTLSQYLWRYRRTYKPQTHTLPLPTKNMRLLQEILLATLLNHPIIVDEVHENLGRQVFLEEDLELLRSQILQRYHQPDDTPLSPTLDMERIESLAPFVKIGTAESKVLSGWLDVWDQFIAGMDEEEPNNWERLTKKKQLFIQG